MAGGWVGSPIPPDPSRVLQTPASDLSRRKETFRSLLGGELEMRFGGNPIEGSNPSLRHHLQLASLRRIEFGTCRSRLIFPCCSLLLER